MGQLEQVEVPNWPAAQLEQAVAPASDDVPPEHMEHAVAPVDAENSPLLQLVHAVAPVPARDVPEEHDMQYDWPVLI